MKHKRTLVIVSLVVLALIIIGWQSGPPGDWVSLTYGGQYLNPVSISAPTSVATGTPAFMVDSLGVSNLLSIRDAQTPVFSVLNGGNVTGKVLRYATAGTQIICGTATVTDTATIATGLTTCLFPMVELGQAVVGDAVHTDAACSTGNIVIDVHNSALTPAANSTGAIVNWCAIGTP